MGPQYIYQISELTKKHGQREVLKNIWLAFYPGAKIGVLGRNGSGKSTLLRIMAGMDREFDGEAELSTGFTVGYLLARAAAEPRQGRVGQRRRSGRADAQDPAPLRRDQRPAGRGHSSPDEMEKLLAEQAKVQDQIETHNAWELDRQIEIAMDAMNLPPGDADVDEALRRRAAPRGAVQDAARAARPAAAGRADEPSRRRKRGLARAASGRVPRHRRGRDARSLLSRQRGRLDSGARPRPRAFPGKATTPPGWSRRRIGWRRKRRPPRPGRRRWTASWNGFAWRPRARQAKSKARIKAYEQMSAEAIPGSRGRAGNPDSARQAPGRPGGRGQERQQGLRRQAADRRPELPPAARRHRGRDRRQRRRQDDAVPHDRRRGKARRRRNARSAPRSNWATSTRTATRSMPTRPSSRRSPAVTTRSRWAAAR